MQELYVKGLVGRVFEVSAASELAGWLAGVSKWWDIQVRVRGKVRLLRRIGKCEKERKYGVAIIRVWNTVMAYPLVS